MLSLRQKKKNERNPGQGMTHSNLEDKTEVTFENKHYTFIYHKRSSFAYQLSLNKQLYDNIIVHSMNNVEYDYM